MDLHCHDLSSQQQHEVDLVQLGNETNINKGNTINYNDDNNGNNNHSVIILTHEQLSNLNKEVSFLFCFVINQIYLIYSFVFLFIFSIWCLK